MNIQMSSYATSTISDVYKLARISHRLVRCAG